MLTTELKLKDLFKLEFNECDYQNGIFLEATVLDHDKSLGELPKVAEKLYFRVGTGPYNYAFPSNTAWVSPDPELDRRPEILNVTKPDNYVCWRLPQHECRLWQAGFPVYFGYFSKENIVEIELDSQTADILKKHF